MRKDANATAAPAARVSLLPPGLFDRMQSLKKKRLQEKEAMGLKEQIRSDLEEAVKVERRGHDLCAMTLEHHACIAMRRLIEMGAL